MTGPGKMIDGDASKGGSLGGYLREANAKRWDFTFRPGRRLAPEHNGSTTIRSPSGSFDTLRRRRRRQALAGMELSAIVTAFTRVT